MKNDKRNIKRREKYKEPEEKAKIKLYHKRYYLRNFDKIQAYKNKWNEGRRKAHLLHNVKHRAEENNIEFNLTIDDINIPEYCPIIGIKLTGEFGKGQLRTNSSIDRIDSTKGYTKDNVWIISRLANTMKSDANKEELIAFARGVLKLYG